MSSEVCPFCGKTYKRLKSHLPHCKAAARSRSPPTTQTTSSQLVGSSEPTATGETSVAESSKVSAAPSSPAVTLTKKKKKKPKLSEQIEITATSLNSSPAPPPDISKPKKKKSLRALIEAAKSDHVSKGSLEGTRSASGTRPAGSDPAEPIDVSKKKSPKKTKRATQALSTTGDSDSLGSEMIKSSTRPHKRNDFWVETEDLSTNEMLLKPGSSHLAKITIQDVKATLGRVKATTPSSISSRIRLDTNLSPAPAGQQKNLVTSLVTTKTKPEQTSLIALKHNGSSHSKPNLPAAPPPSSHLLSQVGQASPPPLPPPCTVSMKDGLTVGHHVTERPSVSQMAIQLPGQTLPAKVEMLLKADRKPNLPHGQTEGAAMPQSLGQVRLRELPEWLARKTPGHPREVVEMVRRGWHWYYRRYIDVRKGGVGGLGMLFAGYCVLSYIWSYPHIKRDRWRKYH